MIATNVLARSWIEAVGIEFHALRPDTSNLSYEEIGEIVRRGMDRVKGTKYVICDLLLLHLKESYEDLMRAVSFLRFSFMEENSDILAKMVV